MKRKENTLQIKIETIGPAKAEKYLEQAEEAGVRNRSVSQARVEMFAAAMKNGEWRTTHQGIAFDENGKLIDGQHRLWAIVTSDQDIKMVVTRGIPIADMPVVDRGRVRSLGDILHIDGVEKGSRKAAIARILGAFLKGSGDNDVRNGRLLDSEIRSIVKTYEHDLSWFMTLESRGPFASAPLAACFVYAHSIAPSKVESLAESFLTGVGLNIGDPMHSMRKHLIANTADSYLRRFSMRMALMRGMFSAIAHALRDEPLKRVYTDSIAGFEFIRDAKDKAGRS